VESLSGFRFVIAIFIFAEHTSLQPLAGGGIFLVLSGCVLSLSRKAALLEARMDENSSSDFSGFLMSSKWKAIKFVVLRLARVLPLYWFASGLAPIFDVRDQDQIFPTYAWFGEPFVLLRTLVETLIHDALFHPSRFFLLEIQGMTSTYWFVQVVCVLYILYPLLEVAVLWKRTSQRSLVLTGLVCFSLKLVVASMILWLYKAGKITNPEEFWYTQPIGTVTFAWYSFAPLRIPEFCLGMLLPHVSRESMQSLVIWADICLLCWICFALLVPHSFASYAATDHNIQCLPFALIIWGLAFGPRASRSAAVASRLSTLGTYSYGIYIFQEPLLAMLGVDFNGGDVCRMPNRCFFRYQYGTAEAAVTLALALAFLMLMGWLSLHLIEEPFANLVRWLIEELQRPRPFRLRSLQFAELFRCFVMLVVYSWPIPVALNLAREHGHDARISGMIIASDQVGNVAGVLIGTVLFKACSFKSSKAMMVSFPMVSSALYLVLATQIVNSAGLSCLIGLRFSSGVFSGAGIMLATTTRLMTPPEEQVLLSMLVMATWTIGITAGVGMNFGLMNAVSTTGSQLSPTKQSSCACCILSSALHLASSLISAVPLSSAFYPEAHASPEQDASEMVSPRRVHKKEPNQKGMCACLGLVLIVINAFAYTSVEVSSAYVLESEFKWDAEKISGWLAVALLSSAFVNSGLTLLRERQLLRLNVLVLVQAAIAILGSLMFFDFGQGPAQLLVADALVYPSILCTCGIAEGIMYQQAEAHSWHTMELLVPMSYIADAVGKFLSPPVARGLIAGLGRNMYAAQQLTLLASSGFMLLLVMKP